MSFRRSVLLLAALLALLVCAYAAMPFQGPGGTCGSCQPFEPDPQVCSSELLDVVSHPSRSIDSMGLAQYQEQAGRFMGAFCYRAKQSGWEHDARIRDTGPLMLTFNGGAFDSNSTQTHGAVAIWYSPEMAAWVKANRPADENQAPDDPPPAPEGAVLVKEMWDPPAEQYAGRCLECMTPYSGAEASGVAYMIRDADGFSSEWYFGYYGFGTTPDWPAQPDNSVALGGGEGGPQYCFNCHASALNNNTFVTAANLDPAHPGIPFVTQTLPPAPAHDFSVDHHRLATSAPDDVNRLGTPFARYDPNFVDAIPARGFPRPSWQEVDFLASQTYDDVYVGPKPPQGPGPDEYLTSTQCLGCHSAFATGLQYYMIEPTPESDGPYADMAIDFSPYMLWRTSPMGMSGRDPIFFAQLESERVLHGTLAKDGGEKQNPTENEKKLDALLQDLCLQCHGIMGERQYQIDTMEADGDCKEFKRDFVDAVPYPFQNPTFANAKYGSLARDGIACATCHHAVLGPDGVDLPDNPNEKLDEKQSACVQEKQQEQNPGFLHIAKTFTGNFLVGRPTEVYGPYMDPKTLPMDNALGVTPAGGKSISTPEVCAGCHTVHLPVYDDKGDLIKRTYEQTTYAEWVFSDYRTELTIAGVKIPAGPLNKTCQDCHMPDRDSDGHPIRSRIADVEQFSDSPKTDYMSGPEETNLPVRSPYSKHLLVGLNVFLVEMLKQFPDVLGIATQIGISGYSYPQGVPPLIVTEQAMLDQASNTTADVQVGNLKWDEAQGTVSADVTIENKVGHSFPSGVGFRRVFVEFSVLDRQGQVLWASGRTDEAGVVVDENGKPIRGEFWWPEDCSVKYTVEQAGFQPHFSEEHPVRSQDEAQIYQELELAPDGKFTTSFVSIYAGLKDNRLLPHGFLPLEAPAGQLSRRGIATTLGDTTPFLDPKEHPRASVNLAYAVEPEGRAASDPDYVRGGKDTLRYVATLQPGQRPQSVQAKLYFQAIPPFYQQDRYCIANGKDTKRLYFLAGHLNLENTPADDWKLLVQDSGTVPIRP